MDSLGSSKTNVQIKTRGEDDKPLATVKLGGLRTSVQKHMEIPVEDPAEKEVEEVGVSLAQLSKERVINLLRQYSQKLEDDKRGSLAAFFADPIIALNENQITITVGSKIVENEIMAEQQKVVSFFADNGYHLGSIYCIVNAKTVNEYKVFTPKQQFEAMVKDIPILQDFASRFNLEIG